MRSRAFALSLVLLSGCVDLGAVSKYATNSAAVFSANEGVLTQPLSVQYQQAQSVSRTALMRARDPDSTRRLAGTVELLKHQAPVAEKAAETLKLYFKTLSTLADTGATDVSAQADAIDKSLVGLKVEGQKDQLAAGSIGNILKLLKIPLTLAQEAATRDLVTRADPDVSILATYLKEVAKEQADVAFLAGQTLGQFFAASAASSREPATQALVLSRQWDQDALTKAAVDRANAAATALETIRKDHETLAKNASHLSADVVVNELNADAPLIQAAIKPFL